MQLTVEKIKNGAKQLSKEELKDVKTWVDSLLENGENKPKMTEEEFEKQLAEEGFITEYKPPITDFSRYENYEPVTVTGEPISETIIKERR
ncbi:MAG: hypothetical protein M3405_09785 [Acidobacteriota bacterium]|jgi:hypothetical protein|nr:hypothetical protein [Acidobacteriota bacterium]